jgi:hypothetical protein
MVEYDQETEKELVRRYSLYKYTPVFLLSTFEDYNSRGY